jgi:predicted P-loop ATPase
MGWRARDSKANRFLRGLLRKGWEHQQSQTTELELLRIRKGPRQHNVAVKQRADQFIGHLVLRTGGSQPVKVGSATGRDGTHCVPGWANSNQARRRGVQGNTLRPDLKEIDDISESLKDNEAAGLGERRRYRRPI